MENTRADSQVKSLQKTLFATRLFGLPNEMLCNADVVKEELRVTDETWALWRRAGLETFKAGRSELVLTRVLIEFLLSQPKLGTRPSSLRKKRYVERKARPK